MNKMSSTLAQIVFTLTLGEFLFAQRISWVNVQRADFANQEPHGYSHVTQRELYLARYAKDKGHLIGSYHTVNKNIYTVDPQGRAPFLNDSRSIEVMRYPPGSVSWQLIDNPEDLERVKNFLVPGGKDINGEEELYFCRAIVPGGKLLIGHFRFSDPMTCSIADIKAVKVKKPFEMLILNKFGEKSGIVLPNEQAE